AFGLKNTLGNIKNDIAVVVHTLNHGEVMAVGKVACDPRAYIADLPACSGEVINHRPVFGPVTFCAVEIQQQLGTVGRGAGESDSIETDDPVFFMVQQEVRLAREFAGDGETYVTSRSIGGAWVAGFYRYGKRSHELVPHLKRLLVGLAGARAQLRACKLPAFSS